MFGTRRINAGMVALAAAAALLLGIVALAWSGDPGHNTSDTSAQVLGEVLQANGKANSNGSSNAGGASSNKFSVVGSVDGLYPGSTKQLKLTLSNDTGAALKVTSLFIDVVGGSAGCATTNLQVGSFSGPVTIPKKGSAVTVMSITMIAEAPNACQGANFALSYSGNASPA